MLFLLLFLSLFKGFPLVSNPELHHCITVVCSVNSYVTTRRNAVLLIKGRLEYKCCCFKLLLHNEICQLANAALFYRLNMPPYRWCKTAWSPFLSGYHQSGSVSRHGPGWKCKEAAGRNHTHGGHPGSCSCWWTSSLKCNDGNPGGQSPGNYKRQGNISS